MGHSCVISEAQEGSTKELEPSLSEMRGKLSQSLQKQRKKIFRKVVNSCIDSLARFLMRREFHREERIQEKLFISASLSEYFSLHVCGRSVGNEIRFKWTRYEMKEVDTDYSREIWWEREGEKRQRCLASFFADAPPLS